MEADEKEETISLHLGRKIAILRTALNWTQSDLARVSKVKRSSISEYEAGVTTPDASTVGRLLAGMGLPWSSLDLADLFLKRLLAAAQAPHAPSAGEEASSLEKLGAEMHGLADRLTGIAQTMRTSGKEGTPAGGADRPPSPQDRNPARALVASRRTLSLKRQEEELEKVPAELRWAVCEALSLESQRLCTEHPGRAVTQAKVALAYADRVPGGEERRHKLRGLAWGHIGNALRAKGDFLAAEHAFTSAERFWEAGGAGLDLLDDGLLPALKASLRRDEQRFDEATELLRIAWGRAKGAKLRVQIALSWAKLHEERGNLEEAVAILERVPDGAVLEDDGRLLLCLKHNLADNLSQLDRFEEAHLLLPEVRTLSREVGGELDQLRLRWTEGRVATGLGDVESGTRSLIHVRGEFASRGMGYDTALASLELAVLYATEGRTGEVKTLARHLVPIFQSQGVHRKALAALALFRQAAEREEVTAELAREILAYLRRARHNPDLRFARDDARSS